MKDIRYSFLFQTYGKLLTALQAEMTEMYYSFDMSLAEIAEIKGVTRQSVSDTLKKVRAELDGFEEKLGVTNRRLRLTAFADTLPEKEKNKLLDILEK
ncbi:MAG: hypothetical protein J5762_01845 [Clostridia bacterium]|nr:hypothetical protein [Clostridia bacterium]